MPPTDAIFGRPGAPGAHWLYNCGEAAPAAASTAARFAPAFGEDAHRDKPLLEIRSTGGQTMFPPSVHPIGERLAWVRYGEPGCKFDEMVVLINEKQGTDKSTALATLARRPEWFTDSVDLGMKDKEVIEQMRGKWVAEVPELRGPQEPLGGSLPEAAFSDHRRGVPECRNIAHGTSPCHALPPRQDRSRNQALRAAPG